ncbi:cytochrome b-c1 complex subunit 10-like isoform X1 [Esox lucius]|uniref:cytochrome b-c1 complex subunit 10-like isoform X1 n=1 Tax=Esox lucius TaxID=8010 RepID=UPI000661B69D|nr:cytochrome b-c1 complex subunit 10-like isoform X1 [Esox lucius]XP_012990436.1 cytochrome b-c1 complex subunit 10-like isoform X1 [Esox lucius]
MWTCAHSAHLMLFLNAPLYKYLKSIRHVIVLSRVPTMVGWGTVGGIAIVHFTDWRLILEWVPYINGKFKKDN